MELLSEQSTSFSPWFPQAIECFFDFSHPWMLKRRIHSKWCTLNLETGQPVVSSKINREKRIVGKSNHHSGGYFSSSKFGRMPFLWRFSSWTGFKHSSQQVVSADNHEIRSRNYIHVPNKTSPTLENHFLETQFCFSLFRECNCCNVGLLARHLRTHGDRFP